MTQPVAPWSHDRPVRNHNPGDLRPRHDPPTWPGQADIEVATDKSLFAVFLTVADGWAALGLWLLFAYEYLGKKTARQMIGVFAPPTENNTASYIQTVEAKVGTGEVNPHDEMQRQAMARAIAHVEDSRATWSEAEIRSGMLLATARWPAFVQAYEHFLQARAAPSPHAKTADELNEAELQRIKHQDQA